MTVHVLWSAPRSRSTAFFRSVLERGDLLALHELHGAVGDAAGHAPVVIDSDDLVTSPAATMQAWCEAVGLPFIEHALTWEAGVRPEWERTARWHEDASRSTGFSPPAKQDRHALASHPEVRRFAQNHRPFHDQLYANRIRI